MCKVRVSDVEEGLIPSERVVSIRVSGGGSEEVAVSLSQLQTTTLGTAFGAATTLDAAWIGSNNGSVLIELPREAASGKRRIWVDKSDLVGTPT